MKLSSNERPKNPTGRWKDRFHRGVTFDLLDDGNEIPICVYITRPTFEKIRSSNKCKDTVEIISSLVVFETVNDNFLPVLVQYLNLKFFVVFIVCIISLIKFRNPFNQFKNNFLTNLSLLVISIFVLWLSLDKFLIGFVFI